MDEIDGEGLLRLDRLLLVAAYIFYRDLILVNTSSIVPDQAQYTICVLIIHNFIYNLSYMKVLGHSSAEFLFPAICCETCITFRRPPV